MGMTPESSGSNLAGQPEGSSVPPSAGSRRRFIGASAGGVGVLLAVQAKSALGQISCLSPSAIVSGNLSHHAGEVVCSAGLSPTDWKLQINLSSWGSVDAPRFKQNVALLDVDGSSYKTGQDISQNPRSVMNSVGALVSAVLPDADVPSSTGIWEFLAFPQNFATLSDCELMRHLIAAWINTNLLPDYPIKSWHIQEMWQSLRRGGTYCPSSLACTGTMGLTAAEVISYIKTTYSGTESPLLYVCKKQNSTTK